MQIFASKYLFGSEHLQANIHLYANICKRMWNLLKFCENPLLNKYFEANIRQNEKILSEYLLWSGYLFEANVRFEGNIHSNMYFLHKIEHLYANLREYFEVNMMRMMRIIGVCKYTEICEYEANKIEFCLDSLRSK